MRVLIKRYQRDIFAVFLMIVSTIVGRFFQVADIQSSLIWPAIGVAFAFTINYRIQIFPALALGSIVGYLLSFTISGDFLAASLFLAVLQTMVLILTMYFSLWLWETLRVGEWLTLSNIAKGLLIIVLVPMFASLFGVAIYIIAQIDTFDTWFQVVLLWSIGDAFGLLIFGLPLYLALKYDEDPYFIKWKPYEVVFYLSFILVALLMLNYHVPLFNFEQHRYLFILFAIIMAFKFGYRTPFMFSMMTLGLFIFWPPVFAELGLVVYVFGVNVFLTVLTSIVLVIKYFLNHSYAE